MKILLLNGPNLNMLGIREPGVYGTDSYQTLCRTVEEYAEKNGIEVKLFQSNHEGALVDEIQAAYGVFDGIVINPGAYTHTSIALLDALKAVAIPTVEVHISDLSKREDFRQVSFVRLAAEKTITGEGIAGYTKAMAYLKERYGEKA